MKNGQNKHFMQRQWLCDNYDFIRVMADENLVTGNYEYVKQRYFPNAITTECVMKADTLVELCMQLDIIGFKPTMPLVVYPGVTSQAGEDEIEALLKYCNDHDVDPQIFDVWEDVNEDRRFDGI